MVQTSIISHLTLLHGSADLVMLVLLAWLLQERVKHGWIWALLSGLLIGFISALPLFVPLFAYIVLYALTRMFQRRVWQMPVMAMLVLTVIGTFIQHFLTIVSLQINGVPIAFSEGIKFVTLPSALLNLILSIPVYVLVVDMAGFVYPEEVVV
ncbi:MAG: hypothetical protein WHV66_09975 [Anaerolineales bacterium]|jgi:rod shape-determining protein MreD